MVILLVAYGGDFVDVYGDVTRCFLSFIGYANILGVETTQGFSWYGSGWREGYVF